MNNIELLKDTWRSLYDHTINVYETIEKFFHRDYEQCINGVVMDRTQYVQHVIEQRENMTVDSIDYKYVIEKGNELFTLYYLKGKSKNDRPIEAEVIAYCSFSKHQIIRIHGQVRLIKGDYADVDMTSE
ncbi:hypothetical protein TUM19329_22490 [Legionella antarctica]|uniref:SnoaL-like domain-containing protein n=1 Tax=Legionella antarctica TaxID=2708020 RepID=A0A6F8T656_9GAMM|nr:hypothetical protein [Legionella antarctica]BCA95888.1 hypothetical protein TUM19329_22490 [Legionella antarctica]